MSVIINEDDGWCLWSVSEYCGSAGSGGGIDDCFVDTFVQAHHNA